MKNLFLATSFLLINIGAQSQTTKTIAVLPAAVTIGGNIPKQLRNDAKAQADLKIEIGKRNQMIIANALVKQSLRRKNRNLGVEIITPQAKGYTAQYIVAPKMQMNMIMSPNQAAYFNAAAFAINYNTRFNAPYVRANSYNGDFNLIKAGTDQILWNKPGNINRKARRLFRYMRKNNL
jgi:hypothetical protein